MRRTGTLPILTFHALDDGADLCGFPAAVFRDGLARLQQAGHRTVALADAVAAWRRGEALPARTFVLTFDDGYRSVHTEAFPVLQRLGMTATVFLTPGAAAAAERLPSLNGRAMLTWTEIREMHRAGIAFGAHSLTHPDLTRLPADRVAREIGDARTVVEQRLGSTVEGFAYPFGRADAPSRPLAAQHYAFACSDTFGLAGPTSDPWTLPRIETLYFRTPARFALVGSPWFPACVRAIAAARALRRALRP
jgi:peptidoglycan/xylan/chitin deacetylase (PgdA/CDA1 family)